MVLFSNGQAELGELPFLRKMAARLRFISVTERWIEGQHARAKAVLGRSPHIGAAHYAFYGSLAHLQSVSRNPEAFASLVERCAEVSNPWAAIDRMGLGRHPAVQRLMAAGARSTMSWRFPGQLAQIIYHVDSFTLHAPSPTSTSTMFDGLFSEAWAQLASHCRTSPTQLASRSRTSPARRLWWASLAGSSSNP